MRHNPFVIKGYIDKDLFCDRQVELAELLRNVENGVDTTLISPRRMGKSGLIFRFYDLILEKNISFETIYLDIYATRSLSDFVKLLAEAILRKFPAKTTIGNRFMKLLRGYRPLIGFDAITGEPQVQLAYQTPQDKEFSLKGILDFIDNQDSKVIVAIDEFQQISDYPEKNIEALLRTYTQHLNNTQFIFCGSRKSLMIDIFSNIKRPFYSSTQFISLNRIDENIYADFIRRLFADHNKDISDESIDFILNWSKRHTFYTQSLCNMTFALSGRKIELGIVHDACIQLLRQHESVFFQYRQLLTAAQWNFLIAVAKEDSVQQITAQKFIGSHKIGTPANARRLAQALVDKELLLLEQTSNNQIYQLYDVFFSRWLEREFC